MIVLILLLSALFGWSKESRVLSVGTSNMKSCGRILSWQAMIPDLLSREAECLDSLRPLATSEKSETNFTRDEVVDLLKTMRNECLGNSELVIPSKVTIGRTPTLNSDFFLPWLQSQLQIQFPEHQVEIQRLQIPKIDCSQTELLKWGSFRVEGKTSLRFLLVVENKNYGVTGEFRLFQAIPIVRRSYRPNEKLDVKDLEIQKRDVTFLSSYVSHPEELIGRTLGYPVSEGEPILLRNLKPEGFVEKGQVVQVQYKGENFEVTSAALAEQDGALGDFVRVKNLESQKTLSGIVSGKGMVEVR